MTENAQGLVSHCTFFSSMIQGDPLYSPSSCCFGSAWPAWGCPVGTTDAGASTSAESRPPPAPRAVHVCVFHTYFSCTFLTAPSIRQPGLDAEEPGSGRWLPIQNSRGKKKMGTYRVLSGCQNILNVLPFIIQYIVPKQLVEKILFSITF